MVINLKINTLYIYCLLDVCKLTIYVDKGGRVECEDQYFLCYKAVIYCKTNSNEQNETRTTKYVMRGCGKTPNLGSFLIPVISVSINNYSHDERTRGYFKTAVW